MPVLQIALKVRFLNKTGFGYYCFAVAVTVIIIIIIISKFLCISMHSC
jgi:hypothetical protein